eukprot:12410085-Karenia_brevis.AAC.1
MAALKDFKDKRSLLTISKLNSELIALRHEVTKRKPPTQQISILAPALQKKTAELEEAKRKRSALTEHIQELAVDVNNIEAQLVEAQQMI